MFLFLFSFFFFFKSTVSIYIYTLSLHLFLFFFLNDPAPPEISPLPLPASLPIFSPSPGGPGGADLWPPTRRSVHDPWTPPVNAGAPLNSPAAEQQPSLSSGGLTLLFASSRGGAFGGTDFWMSTRAGGAPPLRPCLAPRSRTRAGSPTASLQRWRPGCPAPPRAAMSSPAAS